MLHGWLWLAHDLLLLRSGLHARDLSSMDLNVPPNQGSECGISGVLPTAVGTVLTCADPNEGIRLSLMADGGQRSVSWMHHGVAVKRPEVGVNRVGQELEIASGVWQIRASNRACEQGVAHKQVIGGALDTKQKADASKGMTGRVKDLKGQASNVDRLSMGEVMIGFCGFRQGR